MTNNLMIRYPKQGVDFIETIIKIVCIEEGISPASVVQVTRKREVVRVRQICMALSKIFTNASLATIGVELGNKDHATVLHSVRTVNNLCDSDPRFRGAYINLQMKIGRQVTKKTELLFVCSECGSSDITVEIKKKIDVNTLRVVETVKIEDLDSGFCQNCKEEREITTKKEFLQEIEKEDEFEDIDSILEIEMPEPRKESEGTKKLSEDEILAEIKETKKLNGMSRDEYFDFIEKKYQREKKENTIKPEEKEMTIEEKIDYLERELNLK